MASDRARIARLRKELGLRNENEVPDSVLEGEIATGKKQITDEVRQRLNNGATLSFDGADEEALHNFVKIRVRAASRGNSRVPETVSHARRFDFEDDDMNYWRDRMVSALAKIQ